MRILEEPGEVIFIFELALSCSGQRGSLIGGAGTRRPCAKASWSKTPDLQDVVARPVFRQTRKAHRPDRTPTAHAGVREPRTVESIAATGRRSGRKITSIRWDNEPRQALDSPQDFRRRPVFGQSDLNLQLAGGTGSTGGVGVAAGGRGGTGKAPVFRVLRWNQALDAPQHGEED
ncbi:hypothetical protein C8J57DRAFT_1225731 [Mycena rebaudengoi]|nr:hypothetical protein C8J57DRAFT_1225731 [Mycena rebaudengoi]